MNMFRQSELNDDDELIQANRLEDALSSMFRGGEVEIDQREDPELSELTSLGKLFRAAADEATSRDSFNSFHMRSRSALLHTVAELRQHSVPTGFFGTVLHFIRVRSTIASSVGASLATALVFLMISNFGSTSNETLISNTESSDSNISSQQVLNQSRESSVGKVLRRSSSILGLSSSDINSPNVTVTDLTTGAVRTSRAGNGIGTSGSTVEVVQTSPYSLSINSLVDAIEALESADVEANVSVDVVRQVTDELARVGFEMRSGHPGAKNATDIEDFQNAIARAIVALQGIEQSDPDVHASLIAAKIVAEEGIYIATMYVNANKASR